MIIPIGLSFLGFLLIAVSTDVKKLIGRLIYGARWGVRKIEKSAEEDRGKLGQLTRYTEVLIQKSNIRVVLYYRAWIHYLVCLLAGYMGFVWSSQYLSFATAFAFGLVTMFMPYMILQIMVNIIANKEKKNAIDFLIIFKNFYLIGKGGIFEAFKNMTNFINEPLKTHVEILVSDYEGKIRPTRCLQEFKEKIGTPELKVFIDNLAICHVKGGDVEKLTDTFIQEFSSLDEDDDKENTEDQLLSYGLYIVLFLNLIIIIWVMKSQYKADILDSIWGQCVFILDMIISLYIMYMTLEK